MVYQRRGTDKLFSQDSESSRKRSSLNLEEWMFDLLDDMAEQRDENRSKVARDMLKLAFRQLMTSKSPEPSVGSYS